MSTPPKPDSTRVPDEYLFVYGTLRFAPRNRMNKVLERLADRIGRGKICGVLYDVGRYPGAVKRSGTRAFVWGDLYRLREPERALKVLDRYEGWDEKKPRSGEFRRSRVVVDRGAGRTAKAWIYLYNRPTSGLPRIVSGDYLESSPRRARAAGKRS